MRINQLDLLSKKEVNLAVEDDEDPFASDLHPKDIEKAVEVIRKILQTFERMTEKAQNKVNMEIDKFVFDQSYQKQVIHKTWKNKMASIRFDVNKDGVLDNDEFIQFMQNTDKALKTAV
jgi:hypothetical protein